MRWPFALRSSVDYWHQQWQQDAVFGHRCEICGRPAKSIEQFDHVIGEHVHFAYGCAEWPRCGR